MKTFKWSLILSVLGFTFIVMISVYSSIASAAFPETNGKIYFESTRDGNNEIYAMNEDGANQTNLTQSPDYQGEPASSPDGTKVAYMGLPGGDNEIYMMNADGTGQTRLTYSSGIDEIPSWSPDGSKIIFYSSRDGDNEIYVMNADGSNPVNVSNNPDSNDEAGKFSPDGSKIVFQSNRAGGLNIFVMNADGSNPVQLTSYGGDGYPAWSPDGSKIVFYSTRNGGPHLFVMNADGSNQTQLTFSSGAEGVAAWSPDGTKIIFDSTRDGTYEVYVMNADGTGQTNLTDNSAADFRPDWSTLANTTLQVAIDIKPGSSPNSINPRSNGVIPVAILSTGAFDATTVAPLSVKFGPNQATESHNKGHLEDVDNDGDLDLVLHFRNQNTGIQCGDSSVHLTGFTFGAQAVTGSDSIKTTGCK